MPIKNIFNVAGETPLIHVARQGHTSTAKYLIGHGVNLALSSELGRRVVDATLAFSAEAKSRADAVLKHKEYSMALDAYTQSLISNEIIVKKDTSETPLIHVARQGHTSTAKYLIGHGVNLALSSELGRRVVDATLAFWMIHKG
ncbi:ankyrin repeat family protein, partial [Tanacetum coccineum]